MLPSPVPTPLAPPESSTTCTLSARITTSTESQDPLSGVALVAAALHPEPHHLRLLTRRLPTRRQQTRRRLLLPAMVVVERSPHGDNAEEMITLGRRRVRLGLA
jgi:hypothetical protein